MRAFEIIRAKKEARRRHEIARVATLAATREKKTKTEKATKK